MGRLRSLLLGPLALLFVAGAVTAATGDDDAAVARHTIDALGRDAGPTSLTADPVAQAKLALERAARMRAAGDEAHARLAEGLAREWAELARDTAETASLEDRGAAAVANAADAGVHAERERALLEESVARLGRLRALLSAAEKEMRAPDGGKK